MVGSYVALLLSVSILFFTAERWQGWIAGFFGAPAILASIAILISGRTTAGAPVPRLHGALILIFSLFLVYLTYPLAKTCKPLDLLSRASLVFAVLAFFIAALRADWTQNYVWLLACLASFAIVRWRMTSETRARKR